MEIEVKRNGTQGCPFLDTQSNLCLPSGVRCSNDASFYADSCINLPHVCPLRKEPITVRLEDES